MLLTTDGGEIFFAVPKVRIKAPFSTSPSFLELRFSSRRCVGGSEVTGP